MCLVVNVDFFYIFSLLTFFHDYRTFETLLIPHFSIICLSTTNWKLYEKIVRLSWLDKDDGSYRSYFPFCHSLKHFLRNTEVRYYEIRSTECSFSSIFLKSTILWFIPTYEPHIFKLLMFRYYSSQTENITPVIEKLKIARLF